MAYEVAVETLAPRTLAAVRRRVPINEVGKAFKPALDQVWAFLSKHPGLRTDGHTAFLYHHENPAIMPVDFGVEVVRTFTGEGEVQCVTTPAGEAAVVVHRGPYEQMRAAHQTLHAWCAANRRTIGGYSLEISRRVIRRRPAPPCTRTAATRPSAPAPASSRCRAVRGNAR